MEINTGSVIPMTAFTLVSHDDKGKQELAMSYKAAKDRRFVFMLLGVENRNNTQPLDPSAVLHVLGWQPADPELRKIFYKKLQIEEPVNETPDAGSI